MKALTIMLAALPLSACFGPQTAMNTADPVCRDGVEYLRYIEPGVRAIVPHLKPDGTPYTCKVAR